MIGAIASFVVRQVPLPVIAVAAVIIFYEGLPLGPLRSIPLVGPALEGFADGKVDRAWKDGLAEGARLERAAWVKASEELRQQMEAERELAQAKIADAERRFLFKQAAAQSQFAALATTIADMEAPEPDAKDDPACRPRPAISGRLSKSLDAVGRWPAEAGGHARLPD